MFDGWADSMAAPQGCPAGPHSFDRHRPGGRGAKRGRGPGEDARLLNAFGEAIESAPNDGHIWYRRDLVLCGVGVSHSSSNLFDVVPP